MITRHIQKIRQAIRQRTSNLRPYSGQEFTQTTSFPVLRPVIWSVSAITSIYISAAWWEVSREVQDYNEYRKSNSFWAKEATYELLENRRINAAQAELDQRRDVEFSFEDIASGAWLQKYSKITTPEKAAWTAIGLNTTIHLSTQVLRSQALARTFFHLPGSGRNWTLLTSTFGHAGPIHLLLNMYVLNNFTLPVAASRTFQGSAPHGMAFYLSTGILASLSYHLQAAVKPMYRSMPCLGASGAIMAMLGVFGMSYPDAGIGIIFLPFYLPASQALVGITAFELYGTLFGTRLGLAHVAHLGGLLSGIGYVYFDGGVRVWHRTKRWIYHSMYEKQSE